MTDPVSQTTDPRDQEATDMGLHKLSEWMPPVYDGDSMELPPQVVRTAAKWLMWKHRMTEAQAIDLLKNLPRGTTRQRQRAEAIDVADFVSHL